MNRVQKESKLSRLGIIVTILAIAGTAWADDWPRWKGPNADNISSETGWNPKALEPAANVLWKIDVGDGHSSFAVVGNRVFTLGHVQHGSGDAATHEEIVYCLDAESGREIWRYPYPCGPNRFPGPAASPVVDGDRLYTVGRDAECICFQAKDGMVLWKRNLVTSNLGNKPQWGYCASPVIWNDLVLLNIGESGAALDKKTGKVVWSSAPNLGWLAAPVLITQDDQHRAVISSNRALYAVDPKTGTVAWSHPWHSDADPVFLGDRLLLTGGRAGQACTLLDISGAEPKVAWQNRQTASTFQSAVVLDGHIYAFGRTRNKATLSCMNLETGEQTWSEELGDWGALIAADGKLIILDGAGDLIVAQASPEAYRVLSQARILPQEDWRQTDEAHVKACWTTPVLAHGRVYVRNTWGEMACVAMN